MRFHLCRNVLTAVLAIMVAALVNAQALDAQAPAAERWQSLSAQAQEAYQAGDYATAATVAETALRLARQTLGDRSQPMLTSLHALATVYLAQGRHGEAEPLFLQALKGRREVLGPRHPDTLTALSNLADLYRVQGRYGDAEPLYQEALQARRDTLGARHPHTFTTMNNLALLYSAQGRYGEAEPLFWQVLQGLREVLGPRDQNTLTTLNNLAELYRLQGRYGEAEPLFRQAVQGYRETFGPRHPNTLMGLNNLALLHSSQGRYGEAEPLFFEVLQASRETLGPRHPTTFTSLSNLAALYQNQGRYAEAEALLREALQASRETHGPRHPTTLTALNNLAEVVRDQGRYGEAEPLYREVLQTSRETLGPRHPHMLASLNNLALLYDQQGRYGEAEPLFREVLQASRETLGPRHQLTLTALNGLAEILRVQGRYGEAEPLYREAMQGSRDTLGPHHPYTLVSLNNLALLYHDQGRYGEAEALLREALQASREAFGPRHPDTLRSLHNLATLYDMQGLYGEAEPLHLEAVNGMREVRGPRHPETLETQFRLSLNLAGQKRRAEAVRMLQELEPDLLGRIGDELRSTEGSAVRRELVSSQASFQDVVLTLATTADSSDASRSDANRLAGTVMLRFKLLQGEEEAYLARLVRRLKDPRVQTLANDIGKLRIALAAAAEGAPNAFEKTQQALEAKRRELIDASPEYKDRLRVLNARLDDVRLALPAGSALIEFRQFRPVDFGTMKPGEPRFAGLLLTGSGEPVVADLGPVSEVQSLATALDNSPAHGRGLAAPALALDDLAAAKLFERLLAPFKDALTSAAAAHVAPDGILNLIPFARLKLPDGRYWFEQQEIHLLQTGRDLLRAGVDHPARGLLALGGIDFGAAPVVGTDPSDSAFFAAAGSDRSAAVTRAALTFHAGFGGLPATADEVKQVARWYRARHTGEPAEIWSGAAASKTRLMALKTPPRVLHLATHGFYLPNQSREPMLLSGIALAGANREVAGTGNDGLLFALEAEGLNLDGTELVVLSACDTAQGRVDYSEGVFGLARALRTAGARNVLVTLWPLDDGLARDFMADFYKNWTGRTGSNAHTGPAQALRDTQRQWTRRADRRDPRAWAPYVLIE